MRRFARDVRVCTPVMVALLALLLSGCAIESAPPTPTALPPPTATPTPRPTVEVAWHVVVTSVPPRPRPRPRSTPRPKPTVVVLGPFLQLFPAAGPPVSRTIWVQGLHLPPSRQVQLLWSPNGRLSPVGTTTYTDRRGSLWTRFTLPGSPPGLYQVIAAVDNIPQATARYRVVSAARLSVQVTSSATGELLQVRGAKFIPGVSLVLIVYPVVRGGQPLLIGTVRAGTHGRFHFSHLSHRLVPGEYILRASSAQSAQTAEMPFQVVV